MYSEADVHQGPSQPSTQVQDSTILTLQQTTVQQIQELFPILWNGREFNLETKVMAST